MLIFVFDRTENIVGENAPFPTMFSKGLFLRVVKRFPTLAITEHDHTPPPLHCYRAGFGHRMENGLVRVEMDMKIAYAQLHIHTNIMCKCKISTCKNVGVMLWITMIQHFYLQVQGEIIQQLMTVW